MAYSTNPNLPKARAAALRLLILERVPLSVVADRSGVHRTTLWRWVRKWKQLNEHCQLTNDHQSSRRPGTVFRWEQVRWRIPTDSSRPHHHPHAISEYVVDQVLAVRRTLNRCAEVVWHHITHVLRIQISLSSVKRIFRRCHLYDRPGRQRRTYHKRLPRPVVTAPGALVQTDTVHLVNPATRKRIYVYTVIDLYTRMAYATVAPRILPGIAVRAVLEAQKAFGFHFAMVQSDNGPEFSRYFEERLHGHGIQTRHSRLHRPNDNAHIERFNRTIQEECTGRYWNRRLPLEQLQQRITTYLDYYNTQRVHLSLQLRVPVEMLQR